MDECACNVAVKKLEFEVNYQGGVCVCVCDVCSRWGGGGSAVKNYLHNYLHDTICHMQWSF